MTELEAIRADLEAVESRLSDYRYTHVRVDDDSMDADTRAALNAISEASALLGKAIAQQRRAGT